MFTKLPLTTNSWTHFSSSTEDKEAYMWLFVWLLLCFVDGTPCSLDYTKGQTHETTLIETPLHKGKINKILCWSQDVQEDAWGDGKHTTCDAQDKLRSPGMSNSPKPISFYFLLPWSILVTFCINWITGLYVKGVRFGLGFARWMGTEQ